MKIFYHTDDDGQCAAAIVYRELRNIFEPVADDDIIPYSHTGEIATVEFKIIEHVYIVDLSLDDTIFNKVIKPAVNAGSTVVHIDHHQTTLDYIKSMTDEDRSIMDKVKMFYKIGLSGTMLTWVYALMNEDERMNPSEVLFDFTDGFTHVAFNVGKNNMREYNIPDVIRFIDDNDVWRHELDDTKYFSLGFQMEEDKTPTAKVWDNLIYSSNSRETYAYVNNGKLLWDYQTAQNNRNMRNAFESDVFGVKCLCLNGYGNSRIFGDKFDEYPMVCRFNYDGSANKWRYSLFSSEKYSEPTDVSVIAKTYGGGGHRHAAGFVTDEFIFGK